MPVIEDAVNIVYKYALSISKPKHRAMVQNCLREIIGSDICFCEDEKGTKESYDEVQAVLSKINERESIRKAKGVYYTPADVVKFIVENSIKFSNDTLSKDNIAVSGMGDVNYKVVSKRKKAFDPTCGAGEFLLAMLEAKFDLWERNAKRTIKTDISSIIGTIYGNDINRESIAIAKLRLFVCAIQRYGIEKCAEVPRVMERNFTTDDYVVSPPSADRLFDMMIGNPPYVEDEKSGLELMERYGNIYANVLVNAAKRLNRGGTLGFIIPLSYVATPRMKTLREKLFALVPEQYILSYSDRPDCLFTSVHQKLCILFCRNSRANITVKTGNYQYWYKEERTKLFNRTRVIENPYMVEEFIPKLGNDMDSSIYDKIVNESGTQNIQSMLSEEGGSVFLNMRAAFWIKAFRNMHAGSEYRQFVFENDDVADYMFCLFHSSLFWWYWICVSDCWHITRKELSGFMVRQVNDFAQLRRLAGQLERKLEETKVYVGTVQTDYEYKHKLCVDEIHEIDDYINGLYGLTDKENDYIKKFAYIYRVSGGVVDNEGD